MTRLPPCHSSSSSATSAPLSIAFRPGEGKNHLDSKDRPPPQHSSRGINRDRRPSHRRSLSLKLDIVVIFPIKKTFVLLSRCEQGPKVTSTVFDISSLSRVCPLRLYLFAKSVRLLKPTSSFPLCNVYTMYYYPFLSPVHRHHIPIDLTFFFVFFTSFLSLT